MYPRASKRKNEDTEYANEARELTENFQKGKRGIIRKNCSVFHWNAVVTVSTLWRNLGIMKKAFDYCYFYFPKSYVFH